jgi:hypothetical protein
MLHTILIFGAISIAGVICFFALLFRFMRGWNGHLGSQGALRSKVRRGP